MLKPFDLIYRNGYSAHMLPKLRSEAWMKFADGAPCTLKLCSYIPGYRCSPEINVVGCHQPAFGKGASTKTSDFSAVFGCDRCHAIESGVDIEARDYLNKHHPTALWERRFHAVVETITFMWIGGVVIVPDAEEA